MNIPFLDLKEINRPYQDSFQSLHDVIQSGWYILGKEGNAFEKEYAAFCEVPYCLGVSNGLDAITILLQACHFPEGSEILVPSNTYIATILGIIRAGCVPVLVEPNEYTFLIDAEALVEKLTYRTRALFFVELYGQTGDLSELRDFCRANSLYFFCDAAQSHGVMHQGKPTTYWFDGVAHSFYPTKNLGALGDAGAITVGDETLAHEIRTLRNYGSSEKYVFEQVGLNARLDEIQAAVLRLKLPFLHAENTRRKAIAKRYLQEIQHDDILLPRQKFDSVWHLFVIRTSARQELQRYLRENGIGSEIHYPIPPHRQAALANCVSGSYPISERIHQEVLSLPLHPRLEDTQIDSIIQILHTWKKK